MKEYFIVSLFIYYCHITAMYSTSTVLIMCNEVVGSRTDIRNIWTTRPLHGARPFMVMHFNTTSLLT